MWSTTVTITRELEDGTDVEIDVGVDVSPGERQWFNPIIGEGHPGSGPEAEVGTATLNGIEVELTDDEAELVAEHAVEQYADDTTY